MKKYLLFVLIAINACIAKESGLVVAEEKVWSKSLPWHDNVKLKVCWPTEGDYLKIIDPHENADLGHHNLKEMKDTVEDAVKKTWEKYSGIEFNFVDGHSTTCDIKIYIEEISRSKSFAGKRPGGLITEMWLNLTQLRYLSKDFPEELTSTQRARLRSQWEAQRAILQNNGTLQSFLIRKARYTGVHEFGHAIGILHEHERAEADALKESHASGNTIGSRPVAYYDPYSIMNYNSYEIDSNYIHRDRDGQVLPDTPRLSCGDIITSRFLYPPPSSKANLIPCCTQDRYQYLMNIQFDTHLKWADFYSMNKSCLEGGEVRIGQLATQSCVALAKQSGNADVCKNNGVGIATEGEIIRCGGAQCDKINREKAEFLSDVSMFWRNEMPYFRLKISVPNLPSVGDGKIKTGAVKFQASDDFAWSFEPKGTVYSGGFDASTSLSTWTIEAPLGKGKYYSEKGCFCEYTGQYPMNGSFAKFDETKGLFLVDRSFTRIRVPYLIKNGMMTVFYNNAYRRELSPTPPLVSDLSGTVDFVLNTGDEFSLGYIYKRWPNNAPHKPVISSVTASDNGAGVVTVNWNPASDPDGDPVHYYVELNAKSTSWYEWHWKYAAASTSVQFTGLPRNTKYDVFLAASDSKDKSFSDPVEVTTMSLPDACGDRNTTKVLLSQFPESMIRNKFKINDYTTIPSGVSNTNVWTYGESICVEHSPSGFEFTTITIPPGLEKTDWIYIETDDLVFAKLIYGPENQPGNQITPGKDLDNAWAYGASNLIRLSDWWGKLDWPDSKRLEKIRISYKVPPTTRGTHRFGRVLVLKDGPFTINYRGLRVNDQFYNTTLIDHAVYQGEPVELALDTWEDHVTYSGNLFSSFGRKPNSPKQFLLSNTPNIGQNNFNLSIQNMIHLNDAQAVTLKLNVNAKPVLNGLSELNGNWAKVLIPGRTYRLELAGVIKPIRTIRLELNGAQVPLDFRDGLYCFTAPNGLKGVNSIRAFVDGAQLADLHIRRLSLTPILGLLLDN